MDHLRDLNLGSNWSLFLDRDGVINRRLPGDYVQNWEQFEFLPGVLEAMSRFAGVFGTIVIVTNQRGIGRGLMTEQDLRQVHDRMLDELTKNGGRVDRIYHCPHDIAAHCDCRKPGIALALRAKRDFDRIEFARSIMVGDAASDMNFAERAGLSKVWVGAEPPPTAPVPDFCFPSLFAFSAALVNP